MPHPRTNSFLVFHVLFNFSKWSEMLVFSKPFLTLSVKINECVQHPNWTVKIKHLGGQRGIVLINSPVTDNDQKSTTVKIHIIWTWVDFVAYLSEQRLLACLQLNSEFRHIFLIFVYSFIAWGKNQNNSMQLSQRFQIVWHNKILKYMIKYA